jgi:endonuclease-3
MKRLKPTVSDELRATAMRIHGRLCEGYGGGLPFFRELDPIGELVMSLLSHRTTEADSGRAFEQLRRRFNDWLSVRDASTDDVEAAIAPCFQPELKAPRIQHVLLLIGERHGALTLDFLAELPVPEARAWLQRLPGVGPKTSAAVLLFSTLRRPALPVDSHHLRVAVRLGLLPPNLGVGPAHTLLQALIPPDWSAQQVYDNHKTMRSHGQKTCYLNNPACDLCPLFDLCPYGQAREVGTVGDIHKVTRPPRASHPE